MAEETHLHTNAPHGYEICMFSCFINICNMIGVTPLRPEPAIPPH